MKYKKIICILILVVACIFSSCSKTETNFNEVYNKGDLHSTINFAVTQNLLEKQGFSNEKKEYNTFTQYIEAKKTIDDVEICFTSLPNQYFYGEIITNISKYEVSIQFFDEKMRIWLDGDKFTYYADITYKFEPLYVYQGENEESLFLERITEKLDISNYKDLSAKFFAITNETMEKINTESINEKSTSKLNKL